MRFFAFPKVMQYYRNRTASEKSTLKNPDLYALNNVEK